MSSRSATAKDDAMASKHTFVTQAMVISSGVPETSALLPVILRYEQATKLSGFGDEYGYWLVGTVMMMYRAEIF